MGQPEPVRPPQGGAGKREHPPIQLTCLGAMQWLAFFLPISLVLPVVVGQTFGLSPAEVAGLAQRTFLLMGVLSAVQVAWGHRYPVYEGPAGVWWGVSLSLATTGAALGVPMGDLRGGYSFSMIVAGAALGAIGALGWAGRVTWLFTPLVTGTFAILLGVQFSSSFGKGLLGAGYRTPTADPAVAAVALGLVLLVLLLTLRGRGLWRRFAVLVGAAAGWAAFAALGWTLPRPAGLPLLEVPRLLDWGLPRPDAGIALTFLAGVVAVFANNVVAILAMGRILGLEPGPGEHNRANAITGAGTVLAGLMPALGPNPYISSATLVQLSGITERVPFLLAAGAFILAGLSPATGSWMAALPTPVGYAALLVPLSSMIAIGVGDVMRAGLDRDAGMILGVAVFIGAGALFVPAPVLTSLPPTLRFLSTNGVFLGTVICMVLEQALVRPHRARSG